MNKTIVIATSLLLLSFSFINDASSRSFRGVDRIISPVNKAVVQKDNVQKPAAEPDVQLPAFDEVIVRKAITELADSWNSGGLGEFVDEGFYNRDRLLDTLSSDIPEDAILRVIDIRNIKQLDSMVSEGNKAGTFDRTSRVSATVETQIEFNDPVTGFQRLPGTLEMILNVVESFTQEGVE